MGSACWLEELIIPRWRYVYHTSSTADEVFIDRSSIKVVQATAKLVAAPYLTDGDQSITKQLWWLRLQMASDTLQHGSGRNGLAACASPVGPNSESDNSTLSLFRDAPHIPSMLQYIHPSIYLHVLMYL